MNLRARAGRRKSAPALLPQPIEWIAQKTIQDRLSRPPRAEGDLACASIILAQKSKTKPNSPVKRAAAAPVMAPVPFRRVMKSGVQGLRSRSTPSTPPKRKRPSSSRGVLRHLAWHFARPPTHTLDNTRHAIRIDDEFVISFTPPLPASFPCNLKVPPRAGRKDKCLFIALTTDAIRLQGRHALRVGLETRGRTSGLFSCASAPAD